MPDNLLDLEDVEVVRKRASAMPIGQPRQDIEALLGLVDYFLSHEHRGEDDPRDYCERCDKWYPAGDITDSSCTMCEGLSEEDDEEEPYDE